jgi:dihydroorotate dehydrogenase, subfamily 2
MILRGLKIWGRVPGAIKWMRAHFCIRPESVRTEAFGLQFKNPVGIAAGLDKNGDCFNELATFGPSFIEIGSLTYKPQDGNPKPRLFRLPKDKAIINRMGINNKGVKYAISSIQSQQKHIIIFGNISKNSDTPNDKAADDYERAYSMIYDFVDAVVLNISCPNVENLSELQNVDYLGAILEKVTTVRRYNDESRPLIVKLSPDIPKEELDQMIELLLSYGIDGVVATNTTRSREGLKTDEKTVKSIGNGGLSGEPLFEKSLEMVRYIHEKSNGLLTIIGCGGISTPEQAQMMLDAGATLIEANTGFIYNGPTFFRKIIRHLDNVNKTRKPKARSKGRAKSRAIK